MRVSKLDHERAGKGVRLVIGNGAAKAIEARLSGGARCYGAFKNIGLIEQACQQHPDWCSDFPMRSNRE
jgi:hypothetical protein